MQWYTAVLKKYIEFSGRARRKEFWMFTLFNVLISLVLAIIDRALGLTIGEGTQATGILGIIYSLLVLLPSLAVSVRRLHDTNRSGWWILIGLIPCIGTIILLVFEVQEGTAGDNQYGPDPKAAERFGAGPGGAGPAEPGYPTV